MISTSIFCISDSDKHFWSALWEYEKRLGKRLNIIKIKPVKYGNRDEIIQKETTKLIERVQKIKQKQEAYIILLSKEGKQVSTENFVQTLQKHPQIIFVIWWPYGLDEERLAPYIHARIAFGKQTMPHGLATLVLVEQIYRASMIDNGRTYHY